LAAYLAGATGIVLLDGSFGQRIRDAASVEPRKLSF